MTLHPEIPPNCAFFKKAFFKKGHREEWIFDVWTSSNESLQVRFGFDGFNHFSPWIGIVSAVARDGWRIEADLAEKSGNTVCFAKAKHMIVAWTDWECSVKEEKHDD